MTTPAGYYDESGTFIPGSFAGQLDLPSAPATGDANAAQLELAARQKQLTYEENRLKAYERAAKARNLSPASSKLRQVRLAEAQQRVATARKNVTTAQTAVYEATGQYEKLLTGEGRDAFAALQSLFNGYGLGSLAPKIYEFAKQGYGADVISLLLQNTTEYKQRFSANEVRRKAGLPVLSPAEYLQTEQAYRQVLQNAGLPRGFYDSPTDFATWIAGDVSPTEVKGRVDIAVANTMQANPATKQALAQLYGVDESYIIAWAIDEKRALPLLQKQSQAAQFGGEALKRGLGLNAQNLEDFVTAGLSQSQVAQGFQTIAEALPNIQAIAARYGEAPFGQAELERDIIGGQAGGLGETRRKRLASQERALFAGYSGASPGGLSTGFQQT